MTNVLHYKIVNTLNYSKWTRVKHDIWGKITVYRISIVSSTFNQRKSSKKAVKNENKTAKGKQKETPNIRS